jgi:hypothetical protein
MSACARAGLDLAFAHGIVGRVSSAEDVGREVAAEVERRLHEGESARAVRAMCAAAGQADLAEAFIAGRMTIEQTRAMLAKITAKIDQADVDAGIKKPGRSLDFAAIYRGRNGGE